MKQCLSGSSASAPIVGDRVDEGVCETTNCTTIRSNFVCGSTASVKHSNEALPYSFIAVPDSFLFAYDITPVSAGE